MLPLHPQRASAPCFQPRSGMPERVAWIGLRLLTWLSALTISLGAAAESPFPTPAWTTQGPVAYGQLRFFSDLDTTLNRMCQQEWGQRVRVAGEHRRLCEHPPAFPLNSAQHLFNKTTAELNGFERAALAQSLRRAMRSAQAGIGGARYLLSTSANPVFARHRAPRAGLCADARICRTRGHAQAMGHG